MMHTQRQDKSHWHRWFAWYPVDTVDNEFIWLQPCHRRQVYIGFAIDDLVGRSEYKWEYTL